MRTDKQLVKLVIKHFPEQFRTGLCGVLLYMQMYNIVSIWEYFRLRELFEEHKPSNDYMWGYWWKPCDPQPRMEFLNNLLKQL